MESWLVWRFDGERAMGVQHFCSDVEGYADAELTSTVWWHVMLEPGGEEEEVAGAEVLESGTWSTLLTLYTLAGRSEARVYALQRPRVDQAECGAARSPWLYVECAAQHAGVRVGDIPMAGAIDVRPGPQQLQPHPAREAQPGLPHCCHLPDIVRGRGQ